MASKLTNVDFILLYIYAHGGSARRSSIMEAYRKFRPNSAPLSGMYFARYKRQSPFYEFDKAKSYVRPGTKPSCYHGYIPASVSMWKLNTFGEKRVRNLIRNLSSQLIHECVNAFKAVVR